MNIAWKNFKIVWKILCLLGLVWCSVGFYQTQKYPWFDGFFVGKEFYAFYILVFAVGFLFCLLQSKFQNLKRVKMAIIIYLYVTLAPLLLILSVIFFWSCSHKIEEFFR